MPSRLHDLPAAPADAADSARESGASAELPSELYLLFVAPEEPSWTLLTLQLDRYGCARPRFHWCSDLPTAARIVSQEQFDCIIIDDASPASNSRGDGVAGEVLAQVSALRAAGCIDPLLILSDRIDDGWFEQMAAAECELLITRNGWRSRAMVPWIRCAIERHTVAREHHEIGERGRLSRERESSESWTQLAERTATAARLQSLVGGRGKSPPEADAIREAYAGLLRSAMLSAPEELHRELARMAGELANAGWGVAEVFNLHVGALNELLQGLGGRSARHVLQRTDLLAMEMLVLVAEGAAPPLFTREIRDQGLDLARVSDQER